MPNFFFQRYVNGERMADDVLITKQQTLEAAIPEALRLCRNSPRSVLVHIADDSDLREENARLREEVERLKSEESCNDVLLEYEQAENKRLREENARLREALHPFANWYEHFSSEKNNGIAMSAYRAAAAAIRERDAKSE